MEEEDHTDAGPMADKTAIYSRTHTAVIRCLIPNRTAAKGPPAGSSLEEDTILEKTATRSPEPHYAGGPGSAPLDDGLQECSDAMIVGATTINICPENGQGQSIAGEG